MYPQVVRTCFICIDKCSRCGERGRLYTYRYTVTTRMIPALRWAAMSHFNASVGSDGQSHRTVSTNHNLFGEKGEPKRYRTEVLPLTNLTGPAPSLISHLASVDVKQNVLVPVLLWFLWMLRTMFTYLPSYFINRP